MYTFLYRTFIYQNWGKCGLKVLSYCCSKTQTMDSNEYPQSMFWMKNKKK